MSVYFTFIDTFIKPVFSVGNGNVVKKLFSFILFLVYYITLYYVISANILS